MKSAPRLKVKTFFVSDLQFQLVMQDFSSKLQPAEPTTKSSEPPVATLRLLQTQASSPELENLENNIKKLESDLHEARSRNIYLSDLVETQKRLIKFLEIIII